MLQKQKLMIKKITLLVICALTFCGVVSSKEISRRQALQIAGKFFASKGKAVKNTQLRCQSKNEKQDFADYYVVNCGNNMGFVIIAGDDRAYEVLGYSDSGSLDIETAPIQVCEWLDGYSEEINFLRSHASDYMAAKSEAKYTPVAPLLGKTAWSQLEPYNLMTPYYVGTTHSATGCAATAMAQIMYFHKYPAQGQGQHSYKTSQYNMNLSIDFSESIYNWNAMLPVYGDWDSDESREAVALLMRDCGYAIDMDYGAVSGAAPDAWPTALIEYFNYDRGLSNRYRANYSLDEWNSIIRTELSEGRPVFAGGFANSGGHAFVFDGFDEDGLIHVNWGWAGVSNGYFRTSALTPAIQGTGGADGGFNARQSIITGIRPAQEGSELTPELLSSERIQATPSSAQRNDKIKLRLPGKITNGGYCDITADFGFGVYDSDNNLVLAIPAAETEKTLAKGELTIGINAAEADLSSLEPGIYRVFPIAVEHGGNNWTKVRDNNNSKPNYQKLTVSEDKLTFNMPTMFQLSADDVKLETKMYQGVKSMVTATVTNNGDMEYSSEIKAAIYNKEDGTKIAESDTYLEDIYAQESINVSIASAYYVEPGEYKLAIIDENQTQLNEPIDIVVEAAPSGNNEIKAVGQLVYDGEEPIKQDNLHFTAQLTCQSGVFAGNIVVFIYDEYETQAQPYGSLEPQFVFIDEGETKTYTFSGKMENGVNGMRYKATLVDLDANTYITPRNLASCIFTLTADETGISSATANMKENDNAIYDLSGRRIQQRAESLRKGLYIKNGKKYIVK